MLTPESIDTIQQLAKQSQALLLYGTVLAGEIGQSWQQLLRSLLQPHADSSQCLQAYGRWFHQLASQSQTWQDFLIEAILEADNPFSQQVQHRPLAELPPALVAATRQDLQSLQLLADCTPQQLSYWVQAIAQLPAAPVVWTVAPSPLPGVGVALRETTDWGTLVDRLADHYRHQGVGRFGRYQALRWQQGQFQGIPHPDPISLHQLQGYDRAKAQLVQNTEFLLQGLPALHVLLYGSRGSGKSSLVKALLNEYGDRGLRLIEVAKSELIHLPQILEGVRSLPQKFILFVDDLSFEADDEAFKALKVVLEGSVTARPANVVVYATSNRRHLVREFFEERPRPQDADEIHSWDTLQEKLSFSDRFGLTLTFEPPDQDTYLNIVRHLAAIAHINLSSQELESQARQWATQHNGRSGRTARQFIDWLQASQASSRL